jgi:hypothetical protein
VSDASVSKAVLIYKGHRGNEVYAVTGFESDVQARDWVTWSRQLNVLKMGEQRMYGDVTVAEVVDIDVAGSVVASPADDALPFSEYHREKTEERAEAARQTIADQEARHQAILEEQRQAEIAALAAEKEAEHQAALRAKFRKEAEAEINKTRKKTSE